MWKFVEFCKVETLLYRSEISRHVTLDNCARQGSIIYATLYKEVFLYVFLSVPNSCENELTDTTLSEQLHNSIQKSPKEAKSVPLIHKYMIYPTPSIVVSSEFMCFMWTMVVRFWFLYCCNCWPSLFKLSLQ
jgi:hypothetical protein